MYVCMYVYIYELLIYFCSFIQLWNSTVERLLKKDIYHKVNFISYTALTILVRKKMDFLGRQITAFYLYFFIFVCNVAFT